MRPPRRAAVVLATLLAAAAAKAAPVPPGMAWIRPGTYAPPLAPAAGPSATAVPGFYLDVRPVTNAEFLAFARAQPQWRRSRASPLFAEPGYLADWAGDLELGPRAPAGSPVVRVSWFAARAYAAWKGRRLPTLAEWERAASAGFTREDGGLDSAYRAAVLAWYCAPMSFPLPPAGSGRPNIYGVRDLVGLVWEWVEDFAAADVGQSASCGAGAENVRDFSNYPAFMRAAFRSSLRANYAVPNLGFRCALSPSGPVLPDVAPPNVAPDRSLYQLDAVWTDDSGAPLRLASQRGHPVVIAMIFTRCGSACPVTVEQMKQLRRALPESVRDDTRFALVSFDSEGDTPSVLRAYRERSGLDSGRWILLHGSPGQIRELAMALGVSYAPAGAGLFSHSSLVSVLDRQGDIVYQRASLQGAMTEAAQAVTAAR